MSILSLTSRATVETCVQFARTGQRAWTTHSRGDRAGVIKRVARILAREAEVMAAAITSATDRSPRDVWSAELIPTLDALDWLAHGGSAALAPRTLGRSKLQWYFRAVRHHLTWEPHGVVGVVTPATAALFLSVPQIAAALLAGNAVVWKPAPSVGALAFYTASLFYRAGLPPALLQVVTGGPEAARDLVRAGVDKLHFTGGSDGGLALYRQQAIQGRPAVLELSGRHTSVLLHPAPVGLAVRGLVWAKRANRGRHCLSVQLVLTEQPIVEPLIASLETALRTQVTAREAAPCPAEHARLSALVDDAIARGARYVGGSLDDVLVLAGVHSGMRVVDEEVQGPILGVATVEAGERAVEWINSRPYRLSASIWADDLNRARRLAATLDVGQVWINDQLHPAAQPEVTLAGRGASGFGASRGEVGLMEMVQAKVVSETRLGHHRHYDDTSPGVVDLLRGTVRLRFAKGPRERLAAAGFLARAVMRVLRRR